jgi:hypothetical protein
MPAATLTFSLLGTQSMGREALRRDSACFRRSWGMSTKARGHTETVQDASPPSREVLESRGDQIS